MAASSYVARINLRNRWRNDAGVALLLALTAGLSLFSFAGARRVQSAYPRFLRSANGATLTVGVQSGSDPKVEAAVAALPEVTRSLSFVGFNGFVRSQGRRTLTSKDQEVLGTFEPLRLDRFTATSGRLARPSRADEILVNEFAAHRLGYRVGEEVDIDVYSTEQFDEPGFFEALPRPKFTQHATVVGIGVFPDEVLQDDGDRTSRVLLTPALSRRSARYRTYALESVTLRHGDADIASVERRIAALGGEATQYRVRSVDAYHAQQAVRPLTIALALFGAITGVAAVLLVCLALGTSLRAAADDRDVLAAEGMTRGQIARVVGAGPAASVIVGVMFAVVLALLASPLMPVGPLRRVEANRGFSADLAVLGFGALAFIGCLFAFIVFGALRYGSFASAVRRRTLARSRVATAAAAARLPTTSAAGLQLAFNPVDGRSAASTSSVVVGTAIAIAALTGAMTFGASLRTLVHSPHLFGWNWNTALLSANGYDNIDVAKAHRTLDRDRNIAAWSGAYLGTATIDGADVPLLGMRPGSRVVPPHLTGRAVRDDNEIVLGAHVARQLRKHVGDTVTFDGRGGRRQLAVVGISTFPTLGRLHVAHPSLGVGALVTPTLVPGSDRNIFGEPATNLGPNVIFVRYRPGTTETDELARLRRETQPLVSFAGFDVLPVQRPAEIVNAGSTGDAPLVLALSLAAGAVFSLALALAYAVRRRQRELMVLKVLGFTRRQVAATVWWQASTTMLLALVIGIPVGAVAGRALWTTFAHALDVVAAPDVPVITIVAVGLAALVVANLIALPTALAASRFKPATVLRAE